MIDTPAGDLRNERRSSRSGVVIRLAGPFSVGCGGPCDGPCFGPCFGPCDGTQDKPTIGGKARTLLALLAVERRRTVSTDVIVGVLWRGEPPMRPIENVATLVSRLRRLLGPRAITGRREGYRLGGPPAVRVDLDEAAALVAEAERRLADNEPALAGTAAMRALEMLSGRRVLEDEPDAHWAAPARDEMIDALRRARHAAATAALQTSDPAGARLVAEAAVAADPFDEAAHRLLMRAHHAKGEPARALVLYERLRDALAAELGTDPASETKALHLAILRQRTPDPPPRPRPIPVGPAAPIGRDTEVARIAKAWKAALSGTSTALLIAGEAGIGKSHLAAEAVRVAESTGGTIGWAQCHEAERSLLLQPVVDALTPLVTRLAGTVLCDVVGDRGTALAAVLPDLATVLGLPPEGRDTGAVERARVFAAVRYFLCRLAAREPVLLVLDDLHHADPATVELVHYLTRRAANARLLLLATVRTEDGRVALNTVDGAVNRIDLEPLTRDAVVRLATGAGQRALADHVFDRTRGHTLFVVETLRALSSGEPGTPAAIRSAVRARIRRLDDQTIRLLHASCVLAAPFCPATLGEFLDLPALDAARLCERALSARLFVVVGSEYEFASEAIREALYETIPPPTRLVLHHRAAALEHAASRRTGPIARLPRNGKVHFLGEPTKQRRQGD
jgi:DNA-binding SARP family transcriptional activator